MGGANTSSTPGGAFNPQAPVQKGVQATPQESAAYRAELAQNKRIGEGLGALAKGIGDIDFSSPASAALTSQNQADTYKKWLEMQLKNNPDALNFMPMMPFDIKSTNPELVSNAWANAGKTLATSAVSGVGKAYGM